MSEAITMENFLRELPKCEHHCHLEGTLTTELLFKLAKKNHIELPDDYPKTPEELNEKYRKVYTDLDEFLKYYYTGMEVLITETDFYQLTWELFLKINTQDVQHIEIFFDPQGHLSRNIEFDVFMSGMSRACEKAFNELGISSKLIMCFLRDFSKEDAFRAIELSRPYFQNDLIHGIGLDSSSESEFPPYLFRECYKEIKKSFPKVGLTAHGGEELGPESIIDCIRYLKVTRIDHGINAYKNLDLLKKLSKDKIMLTICPISEFKVQDITDYRQLHLEKYLQYNVPFSINSDDPVYFDGYILENYVKIQESYNWDMATWCKIARNSINCSWISDERKNELLANVNKVYIKYESIASGSKERESVTVAFVKLMFFCLFLIFFFYKFILNQ
ncbi:adenosine deaminase [Ascoidea rubescens DSM 1968]|uniref:Adenine deaminase n=1 Tax=Ascoidea rubescens DSM 1968 TaxID=1344418 RepID=A0A1D2VR85_9ASCO|nr:adenosine deaminase [Ascoidea rubescens DSM 1968]ODV64077.1 adenosine deaminase [Ascoidea rubescens DSM 1968]